MPQAVDSIRREHVEAFVEEQLARLRPASAANRYRSLQQFFRWLVDEGEIRESSVARMKPPTMVRCQPQCSVRCALARRFPFPKQSGNQGWIHVRLAARSPREEGVVTSAPRVAHRTTSSAEPP